MKNQYLNSKSHLYNRMNQKTIFMFAIIFLAIITSTQIVQAVDEVLVPYNQEFDLKRACFNNGTFCSNVAECNVTIFYPNGNLLADNKVMTNKVSYHNYTISAEENQKLGIHPSIISCCDGSECGEDTFDIRVTGNGFGFNVIPIQLVFLFFGFVLIGVGMITDRLRLFKHLGSMIVIGMGGVTLSPGYGNINYSNITGLAIGTISIGMGFYYLIEDSFSRDDQEEHYQSQNKEYEDEY